MNSVLITGGTGYLARGLVRHLLETGYQRICLYSRGEFAQSTMRREFKNDARLRFFIGDVRDRDRLERAMDGIDAVIHAAALKRIEVGAYDPDEMVATNVTGSQNVIWAARKTGVLKALLVSSDKAFEPVSPYGQTKALAESLFLRANDVTPRGTRYAVVRYGNVAGSTGSVIPTWREAAKNGGCTVTDLEATRFYMTLSEAVKLVCDTLRSMRGGELALPTLPAFRLGDLVDAMQVPVKQVIGLGSFEKRHEGLAPGNTSDVARRLSVEELREAIQSI